MRRDFPPAKEEVGAENEEVAEHLQGVGKDVELGARDLVPLDGDLCDGHALGLGEEEELDVEDPGGEVLVGEDLLRGAAREELEAALGVADVADADDAEDGVEAVHEHVPDERALRNACGRG